jgi:hypothetical protein
MVRVDARIDIGDDSGASDLKGVLSLRNLNDLSRGLVDVAVPHECTEVIDRCLVIKLRRNRRLKRAETRRHWNDKQLIRLSVDNAIDQAQGGSQNVGDRPLRRLDEKNLPLVAVQIPDNCAAVGRANSLQTRQTQIRANDHTLRLGCTRQKVTDQPLSGCRLNGESKQQCQKAG